jgi:hypothetical protein
MGHVYHNGDLEWKADELFARGRKKPLLRIVPDAEYAQMWRVEYPPGQFSGMLNKTRAADCARAVALQKILNAGHSQAA